MNDWHNKDRSETDTNRKTPRSISNNIIVENPALGINIYKNCFPEELCSNVIETLEKKLNKNSLYNWQSATVTESKDPLLDARNCVDFKIGHGCLGEKNDENHELYNIHEKSFQHLFPCSQDYGQYWGVQVNYFEVFNFVKYDGQGKHFNIHADHGPAYVSTISMVGYLNDNYEGGELYFPRFDLKVKPERGDLFIFPSTYIYEHASLPMISGTKYSLVVMSDYNSRGRMKYFDYNLVNEKLIY